MSNILSKQQIKIISLLNVVLIIMFIGVLIMFGTKPDSSSATIAPPHNIIRAARLSANENILWETNLGGSDEEKIVSAFTLYDSIYIFGNTLSKDYDFVAANGVGFCAILTLSGNTKSFTMYSFNIARVIPTLNGFAVVANQGNTALLKLINNDGVVVGGVSLNPRIKQTALDLYIEGSEYYIVTTCYDSVLEKNTIFVNSYSSNLSHKFEYGFSCVYDLQYINILPYKKGLMLCANARSTRENHLALIPFDKLNTPVFKYIKCDYSYFCYNVMPFDGGYAALSNRSDTPEIVTITSDFKKDLTKELHSDSAIGSQLFFAFDGYYSFVKPTNGNATLQKMNRSLSTLKKIDEGADFNFLQDCASTSKAAYILGTTNSKLKILALSSSEVLQKQIATANESGGRIIPLEDGILVVANSSAKSEDVGANFGASDIWVAKISF